MLSAFDSPADVTVFVVAVGLVSVVVPAAEPNENVVVELRLAKGVDAIVPNEPKPLNAEVVVDLLVPNPPNSGVAAGTEVAAVLLRLSKEILVVSSSLGLDSAGFESSFAAEPKLIAAGLLPKAAKP